MKNEETTGTGTDSVLDTNPKDTAAAPKPSQDTARLDALEKRISSQDKTIGQQNKTIEALTTQLKNASNPGKAKAPEKPSIPSQTFEINKRKFKFILAEFVYGEDRMTALDALSDKDILADLVEMQSGVIQEIHY